MPIGEEKDKLLAAAEKELEKIRTQTKRDRQSAILEKWAEALLEVAAMDQRQEKYKTILDKASAKYDLAEEYSDDKISIWNSHCFALSTAVKAADDPERKWDLLSASAKLAEDIVAAEPSQSSKRTLGHIYIQLGELRKESRDKYRSKAWRMFLEAAELQDIEDDYHLSSLFFKDTYFTAAQVLSSVHKDGRNNRSNWDFNRQHLARAIGLYRKEFALYPALSEKVDSIGKPSAWTSHWTEAAGKTPETFQYHITKKLAPKMLEIYQACDPVTMDAWSLTQLALLHRHLASSGLLTPEYQELYWRRAEEMLRKAMDLEKATDAAFMDKTPNPPKKINLGDDLLIYSLGPDESRPSSFTQEEYKLYDLTLAMTELGLLLSEKTLKNDERKEALLKEAEGLWQRAEELRPGSSRYARARWAARQGDLEALKNNLRHNRNDLRTMLFPDFETAGNDPALADYADEAWFKNSWYGFDRQGPEQ